MYAIGMLYNRLLGYGSKPCVLAEDVLIISVTEVVPTTWSYWILEERHRAYKASKLPSSSPFYFGSPLCTSPSSPYELLKLRYSQVCWQPLSTVRSHHSPRITIEVDMDPDSRSPAAERSGPQLPFDILDMI